jgi:hypothetical protein
MAEVEKDIVIKVKAVNEASAPIANLEEQLNQVKQEMLALAAAGKTNTAEFQKLAQQAGGLKAQIEGVEKSIDGVAKSTSRVESFTAAIQGLTAGFALAQGAAALFAEGDEELQQALVKTQAAMAIMASTEQLLNLTRKESVVMTAANNVVMKLYNATVKNTTISLKAFKTTLAATGVGLVALAAGLVVSYWDEIKSFFGIISDEQKKLVRDLEHEAALLAVNGAARSVVLEKEIDALRAKLDITTDAIEREEILKEAQLKRAESNIALLEEEQAREEKLEQSARSRADALTDLSDYQELQGKNRLEQLFLQSGRELLNIQQRYYDEIYLFKQQAKELHLSEEEKQQGLLDIEIKYQAMSSLLNAKYVDDRRKLEQELDQERLDRSARALGALGDLLANASSKNAKRAFEINKKFSIAQALIQTYQAITAALTAGGNPIKLATGAQFVEAGIAAAIGAAQVAKILSTKFEGGGSAGGITTGSGGSSAPPTTAGFASGGGAMNPNSQLLNPNQGAGNGQGQGMRAYVVESDVRTVSGRLRRISEFAQL